MDRRRQFVIGGLFGVLGLVTLFLLRGVLGTVFFAITVAYVLYPLRRWLRRRGLGPRVASAACTILAFLVAVAVILPLAAVLYLRRNEFFAFLRNLPPEVTLGLGEFSVTIELAQLRMAASDLAGDVAADLARATPEFALQLFLFAFVVYGLLLRPDQLRAAALRPVPDAYHDVVLAFHERTRSTLYAIYILQAATAFGTFVVAWIVFALLGYDAAFVLAALSGILQFIPILGPSLIVLALAAIAVVGNQLPQAIAVTAVGLVFVAFLPDAVIRPRLAALTTDLPASLYFIGFVGGVLSVGVVGVIAGPLAVALLAEAVELLSPERAPVQQQLE